ncbi:reverse transcriptase domain-containing protein [Tanacetum coccineum]|uniref:Reverse transcriptase domain-containing protein n=1 Tax=Tanacetum coccineum TaxID=301880 RepID=A0ABQ5IWX7_9ASTR
MTTIFHDMVEDFMEVFMDDFSVFGNSFDCCLANLDRMLARCEETILVLNWEKCHFMVKEGIVLGHKISRAGIEVNRAKIDVIAKLPYPTNVKGVRRQRIDGKFKPIYYASKTLNNAQEHYTTTKKELIAVVFSFDKFRQYLILSKTVFYTDHSALKYLFSKEDTKPRLIRTAYKTPTGCTPFRLVYGKACHLPIEIEHRAYWALKQCNMDLTGFEGIKISKQETSTVYTAYSLNEYSVFDTGINTVYPGEWIGMHTFFVYFIQDLGSKEISTNIGGEFINLEDLEVLES